MLEITRSDERYNLKTDWLNAYWHFSFDSYFDPDNIQFGPLRVFNNDTIEPGQGFPMHPHRDMEIVTYVIDGVLEHRDSTGGQGQIRAGEVQRMSAGAGIRHSERNGSTKDPVTLLQMWVLPEKKGVQPSYEQKRFTVEERNNKLLPIAAPNGDPGPVFIGQDATFYVSRLEPGRQVDHRLADGRRAYAFVIEGSTTLNGQALAKGDSVKATAVSKLSFAADREAAELLLIDLP